MSKKKTTTNKETRAIGRPTKMTAEVLQKLEQAYALDCTDEEACFCADIAPATLYNYQLEHPEFVERKNALKQRPVIMARISVIDGIQRDYDLALKYLERKRKNEFSLKTEVETTGETAVTITYVTPTDNNQTISETTPGVGDASEPDNN